MIRRPPRSTLDRSSAASDVYKRQAHGLIETDLANRLAAAAGLRNVLVHDYVSVDLEPVSYTHLRAHETVLDLVCRLLLEKKKYYTNRSELSSMTNQSRQLTQLLR